MEFVFHTKISKYLNHQLNHTGGVMVSRNDRLFIRDVRAVLKVLLEGMLLVQM